MNKVGDKLKVSWLSSHQVTRMEWGCPTVFLYIHQEGCWISATFSISDISSIISSSDMICSNRLLAGVFCFYLVLMLYGLVSFLNLSTVSRHFYTGIGHMMSLTIPNMYTAAKSQAQEPLVWVRVITKWK